MNAISVNSLLLTPTFVSSSHVYIQPTITTPYTAVLTGWRLGTRTCLQLVQSKYFDFHNYTLQTECYLIILSDIDALFVYCHRYCFNNYYGNPTLTSTDNAVLIIATTFYTYYELEFTIKYEGTVKHVVVALVGEIKS